MSDSALPAGESRRERRRAARKRGPWGFVRDLVVILVLAILVSFLLKTFIVRSFYIPSGSMEDTLLVEDRILVDQLSPHWSDYQRGEIIVFTDPGGWLPATSAPAQPPIVAGIESFLTAIGLSTADSQDHLVKRVIGMPGDHVVCCNAVGQITINGAPIDELVYLKLPAGETAASRTDFDVVVPANAYWVLGDNRTRSQDSRAHLDAPTGGFVPRANVAGRALLKTWPISRIGLLESHREVFASVPDPQ